MGLIRIFHDSLCEKTWLIWELLLNTSSIVAYKEVIWRYTGIELILADMASSPVEPEDRLCCTETLWVIIDRITEIHWSNS